VFEAYPGNGEPPFAFLPFPSITPHGTYDVGNRYIDTTMTVVVVVASTQYPDTAVLSSWPYLDPTGDLSITAALYDTDRTLGGLVEGLRVTQIEPAQFDTDGASYFGVAFTVQFGWRPDADA
jgi:hypothetical protein